MRTIIDRPRLLRRANISHAASLGGLAVLLGAVVLSMARPDWATPAAVLMVLGFSVSSVGIYSANRWVRRPRPEDTLALALKGLGDPHRIYHYVLPADHVLLTPGGVVVLETVNLEGRFTYRGGRWKQQMPLGRALRFFVEEAFGNPTARAEAEAGRLRADLHARLPAEAAPVPVVPIVVFVHPNAEVTADSPPLPVCQPAQLRKRLPVNLPKLGQARFEQVRAALDEMAGAATLGRLPN